MTKQKTNGFKMEIEIELISEMLGTIPKDDKVFTNYIADLQKDDEKASPMIQADAEALEARGWTGFMEESGKPFIMNYMIKGFLKHSGNCIKDELGIKQIKSKLDDSAFIFPRKIFFEGKKGKSPIERSLRVMTMQGPRVTIAKSDYMEIGSKLKFAIECPYSSEFSPEIIEKILERGKYMGLGQFRNGSYGSFIYNIIG